MLSLKKERRSLSVASSFLYIDEEKKDNGKNDKYGSADTEFSRLVHR
jgi:hypothetical protein